LCTLVSLNDWDIMARQKGLFKVTGTLGDVNFYVVKGVGYARAAGGGFNGKAIKTKPSMVRVRENASEFGHCSSTKKAFRLALHPLFDPPKNSRLHRRMMGLFIGLKDLDGNSPCGERRVAQGVATAKGKRLLKTFVFVPECRATSFILEHCHFEWSTQTLTIASIDLSTLPFPKGATHLRLTLGVMDFDFEGLAHRLHCSPTVFLERGSISASFTLQPDRIEAPSATGLALISLQFCEVVDGEVYRLNTLSHYDCRIVSLL
jgi:hypothetical protein